MAHLLTVAVIVGCFIGIIFIVIHHSALKRLETQNSYRKLKSRQIAHVCTSRGANHNNNDNNNNKKIRFIVSVATKNC